jgi:hypothetical protein
MLIKSKYLCQIIQNEIEYYILHKQIQNVKWLIILCLIVGKFCTTDRVHCHLQLLQIKELQYFALLHKQ